MLYEQGDRGPRGSIKLEILSEVNELKRDLLRRVEKKVDFFPLFKSQETRSWRLSDYKSSID